MGSGESDKLKELKVMLEDGYYITGISFSGHRETLDEDMVNTIVVNLMRGEEKATITSVDNDEFLEYILHFKEAMNELGERYFEYVEDLKEWTNERLQFESGFQIIRDKHYIELSGREFDNDVVILLLEKPGPGKSLGRVVFDIDLSKNPDFIHSDFKDRLGLFLKETRHLEFSGFVAEVMTGGDVLRVECLGGTRELLRSKIRFEAVKMQPRHAMLLLTMSSNIKLNTDQSNKPDLTQREFSIVLPVLNLRIKHEFEIGTVKFYHHKNSEDDKIISKTGFGKEVPFWNTIYPRAQVTVNSDNMFDALTEGYAKIAQAVDWIAFRNDLSFPVVTEERNYFNYLKFSGRVKIPSLVYGRDLKTGEVCFFDLVNREDNILSLEYGLDHFLRIGKEPFESLLSKDSEDIDDEENRIIQSMHWLRRSLEDSDKRDKLLDLWISMEYIISGQKPEITLSRPERDEARTAVESTSLSASKKEAVVKQINNVNRGTLLGKLYKFFEDKDIQITDFEESLIKSAYDKRNSLVHGRKDITVETRELDKLRSIIERIILKKINAA